MYLQDFIYNNTDKKIDNRYTVPNRMSPIGVKQVSLSYGNKINLCNYYVSSYQTRNNEDYNHLSRALTEIIAKQMAKTLSNRHSYQSLLFWCSQFGQKRERNINSQWANINIILPKVTKESRNYGLIDIDCHRDIDHGTTVFGQIMSSVTTAYDVQLVEYINEEDNQKFITFVIYYKYHIQNRLLHSTSKSQIYLRNDLQQLYNIIAYIIHSCDNEVNNVLIKAVFILIQLLILNHNYHARISSRFR